MPLEVIVYHKWRQPVFVQFYSRGSIINSSHREGCSIEFEFPTILKMSAILSGIQSSSVFTSVDALWKGPEKLSGQSQLKIEARSSKLDSG